MWIHNLMYQHILCLVHSLVTVKSYAVKQKPACGGSDLGEGGLVVRRGATPL